MRYFRREFPYAWRSIPSESSKKAVRRAVPNGRIAFDFFLVLPDPLYLQGFFLILTAICGIDEPQVTLFTATSAYCPVAWAEDRQKAIIAASGYDRGLCWLMQTHGCFAQGDWWDPTRGMTPIRGFAPSHSAGHTQEHVRITPHHYGRTLRKSLTQLCRVQVVECRRFLPVPCTPSPEATNSLMEDRTSR